MTLDGWLERLRMMARCAVVELHPTEVADLVKAIVNQNLWRIVQCEQTDGTKLEVFNVVRVKGIWVGSDGRERQSWEHHGAGSFTAGEAIAHVDQLNAQVRP